jgi:glycogen debranching enzyme
MEFDITTTPFSRFGSYLSLGVMPASWDCAGLLLRTMHGACDSREVFRLLLMRDGREIPYQVTATPTRLSLDFAGGQVQICFSEVDVVRLQGSGASLRIESLPGHRPYAFPAAGGRWNVNCPDNATQYLLASATGGLQVSSVLEIRTEDGPRKSRGTRKPRVVAEFSPDEQGRFEGAIHEFRTTPRPNAMECDFEAGLRAVEADWRAWKRTTPAVAAAYSEAAELAMYVNWASVVAPGGHLGRATMLMSKNWMTRCWSWDHCFNAIALSHRNPDLAWDQLMVLFDHQDEFGVLPDSVSAPRLTWNFCKPPIHGWALSKMMKRRGLLTEERLRRVYRALVRWTNWWTRYRDSDGDGLPEYHHGNDSGWDNATVFDGGFPVAAPDLAAYLVVQIDVLGNLADRLGRKAEASRWRIRADVLLDRMLERLWDGEQFVSRRAFTGAVFPDGDSLLNHLPIVLGKRLPKKYRDKLADALKPDGRFVTAWGPATESLRSPLYIPDGYWRGPIWGSETVLVIDGLARGGYRDQAREIARRYCDMCVRSGFAENFNAQTGESLRDKAYTWGSSAFLILAHEHLR